MDPEEKPHRSMNYVIIIVLILIALFVGYLGGTESDPVDEIRMAGEKEVVVIDEFSTAPFIDSSIEKAYTDAANYNIEIIKPLPGAEVESPVDIEFTMKTGDNFWGAFEGETGTASLINENNESYATGILTIDSNDWMENLMAGDSVIVKSQVWSSSVKGNVVLRLTNYSQKDGSIKGQIDIPIIIKQA